MSRTPDIGGPATRDRILELLRYQPRTVDELAAQVGLTPNGVRAQLAVLERDQLVERQGVRHGAGPGKPPHLYTATGTAEAQFSAAYAPALTGLVVALSDRLAPPELRAAFTAAGRRIASAATGPLHGGPAEQVRDLLVSLGAAASVKHENGRASVEGVACPLSDAVRRCPESCEIVRAMLAARTGARVTMRCEHGELPRCRFGVN